MKPGENRDTQQRPPMRRAGPPGGPPGMMPFQKPKNFRKSLIRLAGYLKPHKNRMMTVALFALLSTSFAIAGPKIMSLGVNELQRGYMAKTLVEAVGTAQQMVHENKESIQGIDGLLEIPMIDSVGDPVTKAAICRAFVGLLKELPDIAGEMTYTGQQLEAAVLAVAETGGKIDYSYIGMIMLILAALYAVSSTFSLIIGLLMVSVSQQTVKTLRADIDDKLSRLPLRYYDGHSHGDVLSRVTNDVDTIAGTLQQSLIQLITSFITIIGYAVMMLTISPILTLVVMGTLPLYMIATLMITKRSQRFFKEQQKEMGDLSGHVEEMFSGHRIVKAFSMENDSVEKFGQINDRLKDAGWKAQFVSGLMHPVMNFISNLAYVLISVIGGIWMTRQLLGIGDILAFIQYSRSFTMPIVQTANIANILQSTVACAERVFEILDEEEEKDEADAARTILHPEGEVMFKDVSFRYRADVPLIEDMDLEVRKGHTIAIVGPTGAGKTTLVNLIMRFYDIDKGSITVDGTDIRELKRRNLRMMFGMVLQDTWLFNGTIRENIAYGRQDASMDDIVAAAQAAHADHFIRTLPDGYETMLNEEATNISQGQRQLLTIARALLVAPPIMILDEATSSVDTRTELLIQKAMALLMDNRTSFVIAHRLSTIREAKTILVMNKGRIIETGNHKELMAQKGFYYELYMSQFRGEDAAG